MTERARSLPVAGAGPAGPCDACIAGCCRSFNLAVDGLDVVRIHRALRVPMDGFAELRWVDEPDPDHRIRLDPAERRFYRLLLRRVPEPRGDHAQRCVFLVNVGDTARCGIYEVRPAPCRVYPTHLDGDRVGTTGGRFCPTGAWRTEALDATRLLREHRFRARQRLIHERLIDVWNEELFALSRARPPEAYLGFLVRAYGALGDAHPEWFELPLGGAPDAISPGEVHDLIGDEARGAAREEG